jgi:hypothetical protein
VHPGNATDVKIKTAKELIYQVTLDESSRLRLKFLNPLGVGAHLVKRYMDITADRLDLLKADFDMLSDVEAQLTLYKEDMQRDFNFRMADIENVLFEMEQRGDDFFEENWKFVITVSGIWWCVQKCYTICFVKGFSISFSYLISLFLSCLLNG